MKTNELISKIVVGLRTRGLGYPAQAAVNELRYPRHAVTPYIRKLLIGTRGLFHQSRPGIEAWAGDCLQFVYDLRVSPLTYDFASYLAAAEVERRERGLAGINLIFVAASEADIRQEQSSYSDVVDIDTRMSRFHNVILPMLKLLPSVRGYAVCANLEMAAPLLSSTPERLLYPADYRTYLPRQPSKRDIFDRSQAGVPIWPMFKATDKGRSLVKEFLARECMGRRPVVITLRNYDYLPVRNSSNEDWIAFANELDPTEFVPIFVHDTETIMRPPPADFSGQIICEAASWSLDIRAALFEEAWLNLAIMHGPMELCWYIQSASYVVFLEPNKTPLSTPSRFAENGQIIGQDFVFSTPYQHIAWCEDNLVNIRTEFERMREILDRPSSPSEQSL